MGPGSLSSEAPPCLSVNLSMVLITFLIHSQVPHNASVSLFNPSPHLKLFSLFRSRLKGPLGSLTPKCSLLVLQFITLTVLLRAYRYHTVLGAWSLEANKTMPTAHCALHSSRGMNTKEHQ